MGREPIPCKQCGRTIYYDGLCARCQADNQRGEILNYSQEEITAKIGDICQEIETTKELKDHANLLQKLVNYLDVDTAAMAEVAYRNQLYYPDILYKDASEAVIEGLIGLLNQEDIPSLDANDILLCLATHGGERVLETFIQLENNLHNWQKELYVKPSVYANFGGWTYDQQGNRLKTQYDSCYPMVKGSIEDKAKSPVKIATQTQELCKRCSAPIIHLMEIDGKNQRLDFLKLDGLLKFKCCPNCTTYSEGEFSRYTLDGQSELMDQGDETEDNYLNEEDMKELTSNTYVLGEKPVPLRYAADWEGGSSVGGFAFWIQDCEIKTCPDCGKQMKYLAQVEWGAVLDGMEGNAYMEICPDCQVAVVLHQQT